MSTETVIEVEGLSKHFPIRNVIGTVTGLVKAVDGIDLRIEATLISRLTRFTEVRLKLFANLPRLRPNFSLFLNVAFQFFFTA